MNSKHNDIVDAKSTFLTLVQQVLCVMFTRSDWRSCLLVPGCARNRASRNRRNRRSQQCHATETSETSWTATVPWCCRNQATKNSRGGGARRLRMKYNQPWNLQQKGSHDLAAQRRSHSRLLTPVHPPHILLNYSWITSMNIMRIFVATNICISKINYYLLYILL